MAVFVSDACTGTDGTEISARTGEVGATWTEHSWGSTGIVYISDAARMRRGSTSNCLYYASGTPSAGAAEYDVEADLRVIGTPVYIAAFVAGRVATGASTFYFASYQRSPLGAARWDIAKVVSGGITILGTYSQALSADTTYHLKLEIRDAAKKLYVDGVERISSSDNVITAAGRAGVGFTSVGGSLEDDNTLGGHLDNIVATDLSATPSLGRPRAVIWI